MNSGNDRGNDPGSQGSDYLRALGNDLFAIRSVPEDDNPAHVLSGVFDNADSAAALCQGLPGFHFYASINRLRIRPVTNRLVPGPSIKAADIDRITALAVDLDPIRPSGLCSSDAEHQLALDRAEQTIALAKSWGWPGPSIFMSTGNGAAVYWRLDLPNDSETNRLIRGALARFAELDDERVHVDKGVHDPARVMRIAGFLNLKQAAEDRPQRSAKLLAIGDGRISREQLQALTQKTLSANPHDARVEALKTWATKAGIQVGEVRDKEEFTLLTLPMCPFKKEQSDGNTGILLFPDGRRGFKCFHEKCRDKTFASLERLMQCKFADVVDGLLGLERRFDDPLVLAQRQLKEWALD